MQDDNVEVKQEGTPLPFVAPSEWGDDVNIVEGKLFNEQGQQVRDDKVDNTKDTEETENDETVEEVEEVEQEAEIQVNDPGEYIPNDYSFDVTIYDAEGKNGKTVTIKSIEQWDDLINTEPNFGNAGAVLKAQRLATKMETGLERDLAEYNKAKKAYDQEVEAVQAREARLNDIVNGMQYLEDKGYVLKVPNKYRNNWDTEEAKQNDAVKQQRSIINFWNKENAERAKNNLPPIPNILDAFNAWDVDNRRKQQARQEVQNRNARKAAGARVASPSAGVNTTAPSNISVGRVNGLDAFSTGW